MARSGYSMDRSKCAMDNGGGCCRACPRRLSRPASPASRGTAHTRRKKASLQVFATIGWFLLPGSKSGNVSYFRPDPTVLDDLIVRLQTRGLGVLIPWGMPSSFHSLSFQLEPIRSHQKYEAEKSMGPEPTASAPLVTCKRKKRPHLTSSTLM
jgi:hypothetical protein